MHLYLYLMQQYFAMSKSCTYLVKLIFIYFILFDVARNVLSIVMVFLISFLVHYCNHMQILLIFLYPSYTPQSTWTCLLALIGFWHDLGSSVSKIMLQFRLERVLLPSFQYPDSLYFLIFARYNLHYNLEQGVTKADILALSFWRGTLVCSGTFPHSSRSRFTIQGTSKLGI